MKEHALNMLELGYVPIPVQGKKSTVPWKQYIEEPITKQDIERLDWPGIALVQAGTVALDADTQAAKETLQRYSTSPMVNYTPKGMHHIYAVNPLFTLKNSVAKDAAETYKIDVRSSGGYVVVGPSKGYKIEPKHRQSLPMIELWQLYFCKLLGSVSSIIDIEIPEINIVSEKKFDVKENDLQSTIDSISSMLSKVTWKSAVKFTACCPAHNDKNPSFYAEIREYKGKNNIHLHCAAGCSIEALLRVLDLDKGQLFETQLAQVEYIAEHVKPNDVKPLDIKRIDDIEDYDITNLPPLYAEYIAKVAEYTDSPKAILVMSFLAQQATYLHAYSLPDYFGNGLKFNIWCCAISDSGTHKSTALDICTSQISDLTKEANKLITETEDEQLIQDYQKLSMLLPAHFTWQGLLDCLTKNPAGLITLSEFSQFYCELNKSYQTGMKPAITDAYDCRSIIEKKRSSQTFIEQPYINIAGVSTLSFLEDSIENLMGDVQSGFLSRFLFFYPPQKKTVPPPFPMHRRNIRTSPEWIMIDELNLSILRKSYDQDTCFYLSDAARSRYIEHYEQLYSDFFTQSDQAQQWLKGFMSRWQPTALKLAAIFNCALNTKSLEIIPESIDFAYAVIEYCVKSTKKLFESNLGLSDFNIRVEKIREYLIKKGCKLEYRKLLQSKKLDGGHKEYDYIIEYLQKAGEVVLQESPEKTLIYTGKGE